MLRNINSNRFRTNGIKYIYDTETHIVTIPDIGTTVKIVLDDNFADSLFAKCFDDIYASVAPTLNFIDRYIKMSKDMSITSYDIDESEDDTFDEESEADIDFDESNT